MAKREVLRELQARLARQLSEAKTRQRPRSWLAIESGGHGFLLPLHEAGEIFSPAPWVEVPYTTPWYLGVSNLRGHLHGVVDLARFLGLSQLQPAGSETGRDSRRLVTFNASMGIHCALLVDRLAGLRNAEQLEAQPRPEQALAPFVGQRLSDGQGRIWQELLLSALATDDHFLSIQA
jgi:twitching motility protein PilI